MSAGVHAIPRWQLIEGECVEVMRSMADASVDSICADPPAGISFMNLAFDHDRGGRAQWIAWLTEVMRECLRVLKPGGHMLVWSLPRTSHWTATAIEDAGFDVRDCIIHLTGQGFPKSLDVSKAIDRAAGAKREGVGFTHHPDGRPRNVVLRDVGVHGGGHTKNGICLPVTAPATDAAKQWDGFGTALKPAHEMWWLARKPFAGTVAECVQEYGTGALNIDGCRIATTEDRSRPPRTPNAIYGNGNGTNLDASDSHPSGRWPPNFLLSHDHAEDEDCTPECPVATLDRQAGPLSTHGGGTLYGIGYGGGNLTRAIPKGDSGGASRFFPVFYCAKASRADRGEGNTHATVKNTRLMAWLCRLITSPGGTVLDCFAGSGSTLVAAVREGFYAIGIEREPEYCAIIRQRLGEPEEPRIEVHARTQRPARQLDLFAAAGGAR